MRIVVFDDMATLADMFLINAAGLLQQCCPPRHALHVVYDGEGAVAAGRGVDDEEAPRGHRGDDAVARLRGTETRTGDVARGEDKDTPLGQGLFDMWRIVPVECAGVCPDDGVARGEEPFEDLGLEGRVEAADDGVAGADRLLGPAEGAAPLLGRYLARGEECDLRKVEQGYVARVVVIESHKNVGCRIDLSTLRPSLPHIETSNTDSPRETRTIHIAGQKACLRDDTYVHEASLLHSFQCAKVAKFERERYVTKTFVICLAAAWRRADTKI